MKTVEPIRNIEDIKELKKSLAYYGSNRDVFLFVLGINCGLRVGDMLTLKKKDIKDYQLKLKESKTKKNKTITLLHIKNDIDDYIKFLNDDDYLFKSNKLNQDGQQKAISRVQAYRILNKSAESIGISDIGTHSMRKTFGYHYYKRTNDVALLMDLFNHSSQSVTLRYIGINQDVLNQSITTAMSGLYD
ncbi:tyrosine-type recombinase/integrase [Macrococcus armenti]|uniref:tyrosine-type recombinase/integrase n=1 Tax=Macrococcus armenti TaxID=2875764 RepID=UPI001CCF95A6|nr:tyrosine-type recombinase/integrase [Macrococcus armenti]UBH23463.1 tyrosine-type recombinase/integrase [Macrococcus armenti]